MSTTHTARRLLFLMLSMAMATALMLFGATTVALAQEEDDNDVEDVDNDVDDNDVDDNDVEADPEAEEEADRPEGAVEAGAGGTSDGAPFAAIALSLTFLAAAGGIFVHRRMATTS